MIDLFDDYRLLINGSLVKAQKAIDVINPATEDVVGRAPSAGASLLEEAVAAAKAAFPPWRDLRPKEREQLVSQMADRLEQNQEEFMRLLTMEQGKARAGVEWEVGGSIIWLREIAKQSLEPEILESTPGHRVEIHRTPLGVVGAITPWNFPILLAVWKIAPALIAGNTMVLKPSPYTPLCTLKLGELVADLLPRGVLNVVSGDDDLGRLITENKDIRKISFTGSTDTGRKIMASASGNLKRVTLELGGNDPAIVLPDVDPKQAAEQLFWAAFQNTAQFCVAAKRLYIHEEIYDDLARELVEFAKTVKVGNGLKQGTDLGPIQNRMQFEKLRDLLADTREAGANILLGGEPEDGEGYFVPITIIDNPPDDSRVVIEEPFGPVLPLLKYSDIDEVIARANDTEFGLAASVWSADTDRARDIAKRIEAGTVWINEVHIFAPNVAFGGHKQSGIGVENSLHGLAEYTNSQTIMTNYASI